MSRATSQKASLVLQGFNSHQSSDVPREVLLTVRNIYALVYVKARATEVFLDVNIHKLLSIQNLFTPHGNLMMEVLKTSILNTRQLGLGKATNMWK